MGTPTGICEHCGAPMSHGVYTGTIAPATDPYGYLLGESVDLRRREREGRQRVTVTPREPAEGEQRMAANERLVLGVNAIDEEDIIRLSEPSCRATRVFWKETYEGLLSALASARNSIRQMDCTDARKAAMAAQVKKGELWIREWRKEISAAAKEVEKAKLAAGAAYDTADGVGAVGLEEPPGAEPEPEPEPAAAPAPAAPAAPAAQPRAPKGARVGASSSTVVGLPPGVVSQAGE